MKCFIVVHLQALSNKQYKCQHLFYYGFETSIDL